jgi:hypothetical protein
VYTSIGGWGEIINLDPPIGKSVSVSFRVRVVRASGRGEAAWACETKCFSTLEAPLPTFPATPPAWPVPLPIHCYLQGF